MDAIAYLKEVTHCSWKDLQFLMVRMAQFDLQFAREKYNVFEGLDEVIESLQNISESNVVQKMSFHDDPELQAFIESKDIFSVMSEYDPLTKALKNYSVFQDNLKKLSLCLKDNEACYQAVRESRIRTVKQVEKMSKFSPLIHCITSENNKESNNNLPVKKHTYLSVVGAFDKRENELLETFNEYLTKYVITWEQDTNSRVSQALVSLEKMLAEYDYHDRKLSTQQKKVAALNQKGKKVDENAIVVMKRDKQKLDKAKTNYIEGYIKLIAFLKEITYCSWKDLQFVIVKMAQFDLHFAREKFDTFKGLDEVIESLKNISESNGTQEMECHKHVSFLLHDIDIDVKANENLGTEIELSLGKPNLKKKNAGKLGIIQTNKVSNLLPPMQTGNRPYEQRSDVATNPPKGSTENERKMPFFSMEGSKRRVVKTTATKAGILDPLLLHSNKDDDLLLATQHIENDKKVPTRLKNCIEPQERVATSKKDETRHGLKLRNFEPLEKLRQNMSIMESEKFDTTYQDKIKRPHEYDKRLELLRQSAYEHHDQDYRIPQDSISFENRAPGLYKTRNLQSFKQNIRQELNNMISSDVDPFIFSETSPFEVDNKTKGSEYLGGKEGTKTKYFSRVESEKEALAYFSLIGGNMVNHTINSTNTSAPFSPPESLRGSKTPEREVREGPEIMTDGKLAKSQSFGHRMIANFGKRKKKNMSHKKVSQEVGKMLNNRVSEPSQSIALSPALSLIDDEISTVEEISLSDNSASWQSPSAYKFRL
eukprot:CAMPEP_0113304532 /NCGR_PEP_ID=MMETSP0010_2-20120614/4518_1 /TAXON_ID=216773 ORGANISM="Corethron hystrix, Strain 308" /NCGR_SAMPLE_ID=MMETSP0010_2 /ASSEMBLY_ACC=CAM_ASM_000155 /LENGTH=765 /DNA_ID=CAMNT_0000158763 /DNA_START=284 /DNA_END=2581 /DNA_ORIENTATION=- /assembly_acc=CAM_ASM_000155